MTTKIYEYKTERVLIDENLWDQYQEDFDGFTPDAFSEVYNATVKELRTVLRCGGVYVPRCEKGSLIARSLL